MCFADGRIVFLTSILTVTFCGCGQGGPAGATLAYWNRLVECSAMKSGTYGDARGQAVADLKLRADTIECLATAGVDLEASRIGLSAARLLREQAVLAEQGGYLPAASFVDGFVWGLTGEGNPLESSMQYGQTVNSWGSRYQAWCNDAQFVRVQLTNKYGTEFPNLIRNAPQSSAVAGSPSTYVNNKPSWWEQRSWYQKLFFIGFAIYMAVQYFTGKPKPA